MQHPLTSTDAQPLLSKSITGEHQDDPLVQQQLGEQGMGDATVFDQDQVPQTWFHMRENLIDLVPKYEGTILKERVTNMEQQVRTHWAEGLRLMAFQDIVEMVSTLGSFMNSSGEYAGKFAHIAKSLDLFARMVLQRMQQKIPDPGQEKEHARAITFRKWKAKAQMICNLVPRIYVEISLLRIYASSGTAEESLLDSFKRLGLAIRGIGSSVIASFARVYLSQQAREALNSQQDRNEIMLSLIGDQFTMISQTPRSVENHDFIGYVLRWILQSFMFPETMFESILQLFESHCSEYLIVLSGILRYLPCEEMAKHTDRIQRLLRCSICSSTALWDRTFLTLLRRLSHCYSSSTLDSSYLLRMLNQQSRKLTSPTTLCSSIRLVMPMMGSQAQPIQALLKWTIEHLPAREKLDQQQQVLLGRTLTDLIVQLNDIEDMAELMAFKTLLKRVPVKQYLSSVVDSIWCRMKRHKQYAWSPGFISEMQQICCVLLENNAFEDDSLYSSRFKGIVSMIFECPVDSFPSLTEQSLLRFKQLRAIVKHDPSAMYRLCERLQCSILRSIGSADSPVSLSVVKDIISFLLDTILLVDPINMRTRLMLSSAHVSMICRMPANAYEFLLGAFRTMEIVWEQIEGDSTEKKTQIDECVRWALATLCELPYPEMNGEAAENVFTCAMSLVRKLDLGAARNSKNHVHLFESILLSLSRECKKSDTLVEDEARIARGLQQLQQALSTALDVIFKLDDQEHATSMLSQLMSRMESCAHPDIVIGQELLDQLRDAHVNAQENSSASVSLSNSDDEGDASDISE